MSYISLYRKYRPKLFHDITGQEFIVRTLTNSIKQQKVSHAYIFAGPKGIGKTTIAKIFAKAVNCLHPVNGDACNECVNCKIISDNQTTDILELDAASNNGVDEVRIIIDGVRFLPTSLNKKVYIIDEAHMLTTQAWNAMLKTVEEAPNHVIFIFATTEMHKIPSTILSRAQHFLFTRLNTHQLTNMLNNIAKQEHITLSEEAIQKIIALADGSARDAISILEQMAMYTNNNITRNDIDEVFGLIDIDNKIKFINLMLHKDTQSIMELINQYEQNGVNFMQLANDLVAILIDKLIYLQTKNIKILTVLNETTVDAINISENDCIKIINVWQEIYMKMRNATDLSFYLKLAVFNTFSINNDNSVSASQPIPTIEAKQPIKEDDKKSNSIDIKELPPLNQMFKVTPYETKAVVSSQPISSPTIKKPLEFNQTELFNQIAHNNSKKFQDKIRNFLIEIKENNQIKVLSLIASSTGVLIASKNGVVLLFEDSIDAQLLNFKTNTYDFLIEIKKFFGHPIYFIGLTKEQSKEFGQNFIKLHKQGQTFDEPNLEPLNSILKASNSVEQIIYEIFGEP